MKLRLCQLEFLQQRGECPVAPDLRLIAQRLQAAPLCRQRLGELCDLFLRVAQLLLLMPRAVGRRARGGGGGGGHVALLQQRDHIAVAGALRDVRGGLADAVLDVDGAAGAEQLFDAAQLAGAARVVQRRPALVILRVDLGLRAQRRGRGLATFERRSHQLGAPAGAGAAEGRVVRIVGRREDELQRSRRLLDCRDRVVEAAVGRLALHAHEHQAGPQPRHLCRQPRRADRADHGALRAVRRAEGDAERPEDREPHRHAPALAASHRGAQCACRASLRALFATRATSDSRRLSRPTFFFGDGSGAPERRYRYTLL